MTQPIISQKTIQPTQQLEEEQSKRFQKIIDKIFKILIEESVAVNEIPIILKLITGKLGKIIDESLVETIIDIKK
ncbi:MAG: hypothetical protein LRZ94_00960 [Candidatus Pacebacteria bacterium]|nr:hypothetical protein [Candidatus Paceibacterota bacterium]